MLLRAIRRCSFYVVSAYHVSKHKLVLISGVLLGILFILVPACIQWMMFGAAIATTVILIYIWLHTSPTSMDQITAPDMTSLPPLSLPEIRSSGNTEQQVTAWFNEIDEYNCDTYSTHQTTSVFLELKETELSLQTPKRDIEKYALWDEELPTKFKIIKQREFNLVGATVSLLPSDLTTKRLWSKKYPICVTIPIQGHHRFSSSILISSKRDSSPIHEAIEVKLYLFARSSRDKEDWYRRFSAAACGNPLPTDIISVLSMTSASSSSKRDQESGNSETGTDSSTTNNNVAQIERLRNYLHHMARVIPAEVQRNMTDHSHTRRQTSRPESLQHEPVSCEPQIAWLNALITRCFCDFLADKFWLDVMQEKLQKRLNKIQVPYFIDGLVITGIEPGREMPVIQRAAMPYIDDRGMWADLDITYGGGFCMQIETKCNLMKLTKKSVEKTKSSSQESIQASDSDDEDSDEADAENDNKTHNKPGLKGQQSKRAKILRGLEKLAHSRYVHKATENKYIKKKLDKMSNTRLVLAVEVNHISGCLAINIPHPPSDRLWYGFRDNPCLRLTAKPSIGEKKLGFSRVIDWIEKKLTFEFRRVVVMPNMQNIHIALMSDQPSPLIG